MSVIEEGYVYHTYGPDRYVRDAVASVLTLRRHDKDRPVALYCPPDHEKALRAHNLDTLFQQIRVLPEENRSIIGFKHHLHKFTPFERSLYVDSDMVWCRDPGPLWVQFSAFPFTATGLERSDFFFGGPKGIAVAFDYLFDRRRQTMRRFGLTQLPRVQAGMIYSQDVNVARKVCEQASAFLANRSQTHFRSRLNEGRSEESCEWSLAMAMSKLRLHVFPWLQGYNSPQLDFIEGLTQYDPEFEEVTCTYYPDGFVYMLRGLNGEALRSFLIRFFSMLPGRGDCLEVTPFVLHFGWLHHKQPFRDYSARTWKRLTEDVPAASNAGSNAGTNKNGVKVTVKKAKQPSLSVGAE